MKLSEDQTSIWQVEYERVSADPAWTEGDPQWNMYRTPEVIGALRNHLRDFLAGEIDLHSFQSRFDKNTRTIWDVFGLKGMSGAMFLNTLVKHMPDKHAVEQTLRQVLPVPEDERAARTQLTQLVSLIDAETASGAVARTQVQSSRSPYFLSAWWHIQDRKTWPVYYVSMRRVFERHGVWKAQQTDVVEDYFDFRETALALADALGVDNWTLERLCLWLDGGETPVLAPVSRQDADTLLSVADDDIEPPNEEASGSVHTHIQLLLARLGRKFNCKVWIAQNDHGKYWNGEKLGSYSISALPTLGIGDPAQNIVRMIDVIWLKGANQVVAAFEIENTTSIFSGLLRMSDLAVLAPNTHFPVYIVSPQSKVARVREQLRRPTFQHIELHERTRYFSTEQLIANVDNMLEWATDAAVINRLAEQVGDTEAESAPYGPIA